MVATVQLTTGSLERFRLPKEVEHDWRDRHVAKKPVARGCGWPSPMGVPMLLALLGQLHEPGRLRVPVHFHRLLAARDPIDLLVQKLSVHDDAGIRRAELLVLALRDGALGDPGHHVLTEGEVDQRVATLVLPRDLVHADTLLHVPRDWDAGSVALVEHVKRVGVVHRNPYLEG